MRSMTGFGKALVEENGRSLSIEVKSVNNRFLDLNLKMPKIFNAFEDTLRKVIGSYISRGHIDIYVNYTDKQDRDKEVFVDMALARGMLAAAKQLVDTFDIKNDFNLNALLKTSEIVKVQFVEDDPEQMKVLLKQSISIACEQLNIMRQVEGDKLKLDLKNKMQYISSLLAKIFELAPTITDTYREKLALRIKEALANVELDQSKLLNEVAFFADKSSIDEEITRLNSHILQFCDIIEEVEPIGRKLDFLVQEFNREANTICSKSNNIVLTNYALELKNEIEKIREQIQNIE